MAAIFQFVDSARSNAGHAQKNISGDRQSGNYPTVFQIITLSVAMETSGTIWPNFELIQAFMHVLIACKYEKDQMKNSKANVMTSFSPL